MLTRSIDLDPFDLSFEEKLFHGAKRVCVIFACAALALSALDLMNIRIVENTAEFIHEHHHRLADLPNLIRTGISQIAIGAPAQVASATALIPRDDLAMEPLPVSFNPAETTTVRESSPVAELSAARHRDAVEFAMVQPAAAAKADTAPVLLTDPVQASVPAVSHTPAAVPKVASKPQPVVLASIEPQTQPIPTQAPAPIPVSLSTSMSAPMSAAIPLDMVPMPRAAPPQSPAQMLHLDGKDYAKAEHCLANAVYFEARSEPLRGQMAVAQVVMNRVFSGFYPHDICAVVYQNANRHLACQFTFACDGKRKVIEERGAWARANRIAKQTLDGKLYEQAVGASTHYHALYVHPNWVREMHRLVRYGEHLFYRPIAWGNGSYERDWAAAALAQNKK
ncbi:MAG TPA: cell wall hydrolase [Pseudolabrys sp.]|nr:cell wall hydrolase [Pseudolabrys sp.]